MILQQFFLECAHIRSAAPKNTKLYSIAVQSRFGATRSTIGEASKSYGTPNLRLACLLYDFGNLAQLGGQRAAAAPDHADPPERARMIEAGN